MNSRRRSLGLTGWVAMVMLLVQPAHAEGPPYSAGDTWICFRSGEPAGTSSDWRRYSTSVDAASGDLLASGVVGGDAGTVTEPLPRAVCAGASVTMRNPAHAGEGRYVVTARIKTFNDAPDAPIARAEGPLAGLPPGHETSAEVEVSLTAWAMSCDDEGCGGYGLGTVHPLACAPGESTYDLPCEAPETVMMSSEIVLGPGETFEAEVGVRIHANSGYLGRAEASAHVVVEDISVQVLDAPADAPIGEPQGMGRHCDRSLRGTTWVTYCEGAPDRWTMAST